MFGLRHEKHYIKLNCACLKSCFPKRVLQPLFYKHLNAYCLIFLKGAKGLLVPSNEEESPAETYRAIDASIEDKETKMDCSQVKRLCQVIFSSIFKSDNNGIHLGQTTKNKNQFCSTGLKSQFV